MIIIIFYTFWCVLHYYTASRPRGGDKIRPSPPPLENCDFFFHIGGLFATFSFMWVFLLRFSHYGGLHGGFFWGLAPHPYEISAGAHVTRPVLIFLVTLDTNAKNEPTVDCLGGGVHGKVC